MSLDEEIAINQFAQGVLSDADLLDHFMQMDEQKRRGWFVHVYCQVADLDFTDSDIEQALADCSLTATDPLYNYLNIGYLKTGSKGIISIPYTSEPPEGKLEKAYTLLLHLFKANYQRHYALEKGNPDKWWYWDLSNNEVVQGIRTTHQQLVEEIYSNSIFRSEFDSLAKLWHNVNLFEQARFQEPPPRSQTHFEFITYDELVTDSIRIDEVKNMQALAILRSSVEKALSIRYGLDADNVRKVTLEIIDRHMKEKYGAGLFLH